MQSYSLRIECGAPNADSEQVAADFDAAAEALYEMSDIADQDVEADLAAKTLVFSLTIDADSEVEALRIGIGAVRTALHAAGRGTPGWEDHYRMLRQQIEMDAGREAAAPLR